MLPESALIKPGSGGGGGGGGDVVGPASSTDNAIARFDGVTGKLLQNSIPLVSDIGQIINNVNVGVASPDYTFLGDLGTGIYRPMASTIGIASDGNTAATFKFEIGTSMSEWRGSPTGLKIGDFSSNNFLTLSNNGIWTIENYRQINFNQESETSGTALGLRLMGAAHTGLDSAAYSAFSVAIDQNVQFVTGDVSDIEACSFSCPTFSFVGASSVDLAVGYFFTGTPLAGTNATIHYSFNHLFLPSRGNADTQISDIGIICPGIVNGVGSITTIAAISAPSVLGSVALGNQTATLTNLNILRVDALTYTSTTNVRTVTNPESVVLNAPVAGSNVTFTNTPLALRVQTGGSRFDGRVLASKGADVAAANNLTLGVGGNAFTITGNVQINAITTSGWISGSHITLIFTGTPTIKNNTAGGAGTAVIFLSGSADLVAANNTVLGLVYDGTEWQETFRKVA